MNKRYVTEQEKKKILTLHNEGMSYHVIANKVKRSTKVVEETVRNFKSDTPLAFNFPDYLRKPWPLNV